MKYLIGPTEPGLFLACIFFAMLGVAFVLMYGTTLRKVESLESPKNFSWKYLGKDNLIRLSVSIISVYIALRFLPELFNMELTELTAFMVGTSIDGIALLIKQKTNILDSK